MGQEESQQEAFEEETFEPPPNPRQGGQSPAKKFFKSVKALASKSAKKTKGEG